jgi:DNA-directed RNA polymerase specialized sigma24 family protein
MESCLRIVPFPGGLSEEPTMELAGGDMGSDPAEAVAQIAAARRGRLLRVHRRRLRWEDLEDCYSQATLELLARSRRSPFVSHAHVLNALEQKFLSRIEDRRRAIGGRSAIETAIARAVPFDGPDRGAGELEDRGAAVENQVMARTELRRLREVIADLSRDQQLVLASQVTVDMEVGEFCGRFGWSVEKYRKVAQRARAKLRVLVEEYERGDRCRRLEPDLVAMSAGVAEGESLARARAHAANCSACARMVRDLDRAARTVAALLPPPAGVLAGGALAAKLAAVWAGVRRAAAVARHPLAETGLGSGGAGVAGGGIAGVGALKVGLAAVCVAGAAGGYAVCARFGVLPGVEAPRPAVHSTVARHTAEQRPHRVVSLTLTPARDPGVVVTPAVAAPLRVHRARVSAITQIRREFGGPAAHAASTPSAAHAAAQSASASDAGEKPAGSAELSQTQAEFGFEK